MSRFKSMGISLILISVVFILSLTNIILNVLEGLPYPVYETIFCSLLLLGIVLPFIKKLAPFGEYLRIFPPLLGFLVTSIFYSVTGIQQGGGLDLVIGIMDLVLACFIGLSFLFILRSKRCSKSHLFTYILLTLIAILSLTIVVLSVINFARADVLTAVHSVGLVSLLFSGLVIPGSAYLLIRKTPSTC